MKKLLIAVILLMAVVAKGEDFMSSSDSPNVNSGVSLNWYQSNPIFTWTNRAQLTWYPESIVIGDNDSQTNTITLQAIRIYDVVSQRPASEIVTNLFGDVETNVYIQVTNEVYRITTTDVWVATVTGDVFEAISKKFNYKPNDLLRVKQTGTNTSFILNGLR